MDWSHDTGEGRVFLPPPSCFPAQKVLPGLIKLQKWRLGTHHRIFSSWENSLGGKKFFFSLLPMQLFIVHSVASNLTFFLTIYMYGTSLRGGRAMVWGHEVDATSVTKGSSRNGYKHYGFTIDFLAIPRATLCHFQVVISRLCLEVMQWH